ncbi:UDPGT domain-containing protein, partial [Cephalotus follicularis]
SNLWKEQPWCLQWLDSKESNIVVYVNFGSLPVLTSQQLVEYARELANSKQTFLWVIEHDLVIGELATLPLEFLNNTKERGQIASWSPQEKVLSHPSIGAFLTHTGWNPTMESLPGRVPIGIFFLLRSYKQIVGFVEPNWG